MTRADIGPEPVAPPEYHRLNVKLPHDVYIRMRARKFLRSKEMNVQILEALTLYLSREAST